MSNYGRLPRRGINSRDRNDYSPVRFNPETRRTENFAKNAKTGNMEKVPPNGRLYKNKDNEWEFTVPSQSIVSRTNSPRRSMSSSRSMSPPSRSDSKKQNLPISLAYDLLENTSLEDVSKKETFIKDFFGEDRKFVDETELNFLKTAAEQMKKDYRSLAETFLQLSHFAAFKKYIPEADEYMASFTVPQIMVMGQTYMDAMGGDSEVEKLKKASLYEDVERIKKLLLDIKVNTLK